MVVRGSAWLAASCTSLSGTPASEYGRDEGVAQGVGADRLGDACSPGDASDDPAGTKTVEALPASGGEDRSADPFADGEVDRPGGARGHGYGDGLATLADDGERPMAPFDAESFDVGADRFGDPEAVEGQQRDQGMLGGGAESGGDQLDADLVAVQADGVRLVVEAGSTDVDCRGVGEKTLLFGVSVEAADRAEPAGNRRPRPPPDLEFPAVGLDIGALRKLGGSGVPR